MRLKLLFLLILAVLISACRPSTNPDDFAKDIAIEVRVEPDPPAVGEATLVIAVTDADGQPVENARVYVRGDMDHAGMKPVIAEKQGNDPDGLYRVPFNWTMGGGWILDIRAELPEQRGTAQTMVNFFASAVASESIINRREPGNEDLRASDELRIVIPEGTQALIEAGQEPDIIPSEIVMSLASQPILVIENQDNSAHQVGPFFVGAGETVRQHFSRPGIYEGGCSIHRDRQVKIIVED